MHPIYIYSKRERGRDPLSGLAHMTLKVRVSMISYLQARDPRKPEM
jgi:hypothetical protein